MSQPASHYFVPQPSHWPIFGSAALLLMANGAVLWMNHIGAGPYLLAAGFCVLLTMLFGWFANVIRESEGGAYGKNVDTSFRWGMSWFIFSEVMFFAAFFGALFYIRVLSVPDLAHGLNAEYLYQSFTSAWPSAGPGFKGEFEHMGAWGLPAINTALLLSSGVTLTWAHHALIKNNRLHLNIGLALTILLGLIFLGLQAEEYSHAYSELNLKLTTGGYGSTFFMLTGFHGFHVCLGATMLIVILIRCLKGHFTPEHHFGFEGVAWYWHFVDVVWLLLFVLVYWL
ncbi:MAG: cytochrome c oxidase subunit 3 [Rhodocyclaceae bacterium]|nr:cytochrome c oxidase subunit 3 [Rhodocyclaceae bacterium]